MLEDSILLLITAVSSYFVGRYTNKSKIYIDNTRFQIKYVYAPLYLFFRNHPKYSIVSYNELKKVLTDIIESHVELIPETLLQMADNIDDQNRPINYLKVRDHTNIAFENLKANAGLPTKKFSSRWKMMSKYDKINLMFGHILAPAVLIFMMSVLIGGVLDFLNKITAGIYNISLFEAQDSLYLLSFGLGIIAFLFLVRKK